MKNGKALLAALGALLVLVGCGGGGGGSATGGSVGLGVGSGNPPVTPPAPPAPDPALRYTDKVIALWTDARPFMVTRTGVTKVVLDGREHTGSCALPARPETSGHVLTLCKDFADGPVGKWLVFAIDPTAGKMTEYKGTVRSELAFSQTATGFVEVPANSEWTWAIKFDPATPNWGAKARVADGWYYTPNDATSQLYFQDNAGNVTVVKNGTFQTDGSVALLHAYSN